MMKYCYLAGPISGVSYDEASDWREYVSYHAAPGIVGVSPMRLKNYLEGVKSIDDSYPDDVAATTKAIKSRDHYDCTHCDILFVFLPKYLNDRRPSIGTILEMGWASENNVPIILVTDDERYINHPLISETADYLVEGLDDGIVLLNGILEPYLITMVRVTEQEIEETPANGQDRGSINHSS